MSELTRLNDYLSAWNCTSPQLVTQTPRGQIYAVTHGAETLILKLHSPSEREEQRGALSLQAFAGHGAVRLLRADSGAQLMEYARGEELVAVVERGDDEGATKIIAQVLSQLHGVPQDTPPDGLMPLERWFHALIARGAADSAAGEATIFVRGAALAKTLLAEQREIRVLHGDIHHYNIRRSPRGWLAFDPKGLLGERTYDCANTLCNPAMPELVHNEARLLHTAALLAGELELEVWRVLAFAYAYACLNASWWLLLGDDEIVRWSLSVAEIIEPHL